MKRIWLRNPGEPEREPDGTVFTNSGLVWIAAVATATYLAGGSKGRSVGDPVHEWVTEGRRKANEQRRARGSKEVPYSSCCDLGSGLLVCLGCRDERVINRDHDGGNLPWTFIGARNNVSILDGSGYVVRSAKEPWGSPTVGQILFFMNKSGGHVNVLLSLDEEAGLATTGDYGQPYARVKQHKVTRTPQGLLFDGNPLVWWLEVEKVKYAAPACVPDDFEGGVEAEAWEYADDDAVLPP